MATIQNFTGHSERMQKMADTIGVDLWQAVLTGKLRNFLFRDIVYRCSKCGEKSACDAWAEDHGGTGATEVPEFCRNKYLFDGLQK